MSATATTGDEVAVGLRWLMAVLRGDTGPGGLRASSSPLVAGVHSEQAPQDAATPYLLVAVLAPEAPVAEVGAAEIMVPVRYQVKAIAPGAGLDLVIAPARRAHLLLHGRSFETVSGGTSPGTVLSCVRWAPLSYVEGPPNAQYRNHGAEYRLLIQSA